MTARLCPRSIALIAGAAIALHAHAQPAYTVVRLGLTGPEYTGIGDYQSSTPTTVTADGFILGYSNRYRQINTDNGRTPWLWNGAACIPLGLTGPDYVGPYGYQSSDVRSLTSSGQAAGVTQVSAASSSTSWHDAWVWRNGIAIRIGLVGTGYQRPDGGRRSWPYAQTQTELIVGTSARFSSAGAPLGQHIWLWDGQRSIRVGLVGEEYTGANGYEYDLDPLLNEAGVVAGRTQAYASDGSAIGWDAWFFRNGSIQRIGLLGPPWTDPATGARSNQPIQLTDSAAVIGIADRFASGQSNGQNAWIWRADTGTQRIGLFDAEHIGADGFQSHWAYGARADQVIGVSTRIGDGALEIGQDVWVWDGASTTSIALVGDVYRSPDGWQYSDIKASNARGDVVGYSYRYGAFAGYPDGAPLGADAWLWNGSRTIRLGLTGGEYTLPTGEQGSSPQMINASGQVVGSSARMHPSGFNLGNDVWLWDGEQLRPIILDDPVHTNEYGQRWSIPTHLSEHGIVAGYAARWRNNVNPNNEIDAWYYDPRTGTTHLVQGTPRASDNYAKSVPTLLTDDGTLYGTYIFFDSFNAAGDTHAFAFRPDRGFTDLGSLVTGGLASADWSRLEKPLIAGGPGILTGTGILQNQALGNSVFALIPSTACYANCDGSTGAPVLTSADLSCFLMRFGSGDPYDNCDGSTTSPVLSAADFVCFLNRFRAGCP